MHLNILLAAVIAGSELAAAAVAFPRDPGGGLLRRFSRWSAPNWASLGRRDPARYGYGYGGGYGGYGGHGGYGGYGGHGGAAHHRGGGDDTTEPIKKLSGQGKKHEDGNADTQKRQRKQTGRGKDRGHNDPPSPARHEGSDTKMVTVTVTDYVTATGAGRPSTHLDNHSKDPSNAADSRAFPRGSYPARVLYNHNIHRANHSAPALTWSSELANIAHTIASSCVYKHNVGVGGGGYGQNIAAGLAPKNIDKIISNLFYNGELADFRGLYGLSNPPMSNFEKWGHFTQLVWKNTESVGCATVYCPNGLANVGSSVQPYFTVCNYKSPGNVAGRYGLNVGRPLGHPTFRGRGD